MTNPKVIQAVSDTIKGNLYQYSEKSEEVYEIAVLVEDPNDQRFWEYIIENVKPELKGRLYFPALGINGTAYLKNFKTYVDKKFIICRDSDCEYLHNANVWYMAEYIYNTVVHSRENFQCNYLSVNEVCRDFTLTDRSRYFKSLFENISQEIAPLFYAWIHFYGRFTDILNKSAFERVLDLKNTQPEKIGDEKTLCQDIKERVIGELQKLKSEIEINNDCLFDLLLSDEIPNLEKRLSEEHSIFKEDILSFCQGHTVLDQFVEPLIEKMIEIEIKNIREYLENDRNVSPEINTKIRYVNNFIKENKGSKRDKQDITKLKEGSINQDVIKTKLNDSFKYLVDNAVENKEMKKIKDKLAKELN